MSDRKILDVRPFLPAKDFALSKAFYIALGCTVKWDSPNLVLFELRAHRFYLDNHYNQQHAESSRLHRVENAQAWFDHVSSLVKQDERFATTVRVNAPRQEDYGALATFDPVGVMLDFAQCTA